MASLALVVTLILAFLLFSGPIVYLISLIKFLPNWFIWLLALPVFLIGFHWLIMMATWPVNLIGIIPVFFCWASLNRRRG
jgi:hypothetical protein